MGAEKICIDHATAAKTLSAHCHLYLRNVGAHLVQFAEQNAVDIGYFDKRFASSRARAKAGFIRIVGEADHYCPKGGAAEFGNRPGSNGVNEVQSVQYLFFNCRTKEWQ